MYPIISVGTMLSDDDLESMSREESPCSDSPRHVSLDVESSYENMGTSISLSSNNHISTNLATKSHSKVLYFVQIILTAGYIINKPVCA